MNGIAARILEEHPHPIPEGLPRPARALMRWAESKRLHLLKAAEARATSCQNEEEFRESKEAQAFADFVCFFERAGHELAALRDRLETEEEAELAAERETIQAEGRGELRDHAEAFSADSWFELLAEDCNRCRANGADLETTRAVLLDRARIADRYGVTEGEALKAVRRGVTSLFPNWQEIDRADSPRRRSPLRAFSSRALRVMSFPPREVILEPYLGPAETALVHGGKGSGKTFVVAGQAAALATGGEFLVWRCLKPQRVLYLDGEMFGPAMDARLEDLRRSAGLERSECLWVYTPDTQELDAPALNLFTAAGRKMVEDLIDDLGGVEWLVVDNLSALFRGWEENEAASWEETQGWLLWLRQKRIGQILVHHDNKAGDQRGTSKRLDAMHHVLKVTRAERARVANGAWFTVKYEYTRYKPVGLENFEARLEGDAWTVEGLSDPADDEIVRLVGEGLKPTEIGRRVGKHKDSVSRAIRRLQKSGRLPS